MNKKLWRLHSNVHIKRSYAREVGKAEQSCTPPPPLSPVALPTFVT